MGELMGVEEALRADTGRQLATKAHLSGRGISCAHQPVGQSARVELVDAEIMTLGLVEHQQAAIV